MFFKLLSFVILLFSLVVCSTAIAQSEKDVHQAVELMERKYRQIDSQARYVLANGKPVTKQTRFLRAEDGVFPEGTRVRQIALIRHGEPDIKKLENYSLNEMQDYVTQYDSVGILVPDKPFFEVLDPKEVAVFTSSIPRAEVTARYLFGDSTDMSVSREFREFETRVGEHAFKVKLPLKLWTTSARIKWILGIGRHGIESFSDARIRARAAAELLAKSSEKKPEVVLIAHGFFNRYIKEDLKNMGWQVVKDGENGYFSTTILVKIDFED